MCPMMLFASAVWCSLTCVAPTALVAGQPGSCVADSVAPACLDGFRVRGQAQFGMRDTLVWEERGLTIPAGATVRTWFYLPDDRCWVLTFAFVSCAGAEACESNPCLANVAGFLCPAWRAPCR